jgi:hypothetical protein
MCRYFFEFGTPIGAYFFLTTKWAILISIAFVVWQVLSFFIAKEYSEIQMKEMKDVIEGRIN